jgi:organic hydroperoxide reductase OsmC/OhrA
MAVLATETASATAGLEGRATGPHGEVNVQISPPGSNGPGTNPEQLIAAGYSACFGGAIGTAPSQSRVPLRMADIKVKLTRLSRRRTPCARTRK